MFSHQITCFVQQTVYKTSRPYKNIYWKISNEKEKLWILKNDANAFSGEQLVTDYMFQFKAMIINWPLDSFIKQKL